MTEQMFYIQDSRSYVGNDVLWWCPAGRGYTTDLSKAGLYTLEEAQAQHNCRHTDIPWPKEYVDAKTRPAVDVQYVNRSEALAGSGITLVESKKAKRDQIRCHVCGVFMSEVNLWAGECPKCGADNRP